jgi:hypothetical protein
VHRSRTFTENIKKRSAMKNRMLTILSLGLMVVFNACITTIANESDRSSTIPCSEIETEVATIEPEPIDFTFGIGPRFGPITKSTLTGYTDAEDFLGEIEMERNGKVDSTQLVLIVDDRPTDLRYNGYQRQLTEEQKEILRMASVGSSFHLTTYFEPISKLAEEKGYHIFYPHFTIVPETQATYVFGFDAVCDYLKETVKDDIQNLKEEDLTSAMLSFRVGTSGQVEHPRLMRSCGFSSIDEKLMKAILSIPGSWIPAKNERGESVSQELVFFYGRTGC